MSGVPDYALGDTIDFKFTTRRFTTGVPTAFSSGAVEIYEDNSITQITGAETLTLEFDGVAGLHNLRVVATGGNGFETGKSYHAVVSAGTVDGTSVVGEVVAQFSIERSPAFARIGAPAGASIAADLADMPTVAEVEARTLVAASYFDPAADTVVNVTNVATLTGHTVQTGDSFARLGAAGASLTDLGGMSTGMKAEVETEVDDGLIAKGLDHLVFTSVVGADVADNSIIAQMVDSAATADWDNFDNTAHSLKHIDEYMENSLILGGPIFASIGKVLDVDNVAIVVTNQDITALTVGGRIKADVTAIDGDATAATNLSAHALETIPVTFTTSGGGTTTAILNQVDGAAASSTDDVYNGRILVFNVGALNHQIAEITDYVGSTKAATISAVTTPPTASHTARMV